MSNYESLTMDQLWKRATDGDDEALQEIVMRFDKVILAQSKVAGQINEDIAQGIREQFVRAIRKHVGSTTK